MTIAPSHRRTRIAKTLLVAGLVMATPVGAQTRFAPFAPPPPPALEWTAHIPEVPRPPQVPLLPLAPLPPQEPPVDLPPFDLLRIDLPRIDLPRIELPPFDLQLPALVWTAPLPAASSFSQDPHFAQVPRVPPAPPVQVVRVGRAGTAEGLYDQARALIEQNRYDRAIDNLDRVIEMRGDRTDAAMYWKAYSLARIARGADALATLADMQKRFGDSRWIRDARALEVEVRQASGQNVSADSQNDEELKLLALRGLIQRNAEAALPVIEKMLAGTSSPRVKEQALFVLSQSGSAKARELILGVARGGSNPDLQLKAIRYLGMGGLAQSGQVLDEIYRGSSDVAVKRAILRSFMTAGARDRLLGVAKSETSAELRGEAVQQLGALGAGNELLDLYRSETSVEVKKRILQGMHVSGSVEGLAATARTETDSDLKRTAIRSLGMTNRPAANEALLSIYASNASTDIRRAVVGALSMQSNAKPLVDLARAEKNPEMKKEIVSRLSMMQSKEATDYLLELLK